MLICDICHQDRIGLFRADRFVLCEDCVKNTDLAPKSAINDDKDSIKIVDLTRNKQS